MDVEFISQGGQNSYNFDNSINNDGSVKAKSNDQLVLGENSNVDVNDKNQSISEKDAKKAAEVVNKLLKDKDVHIEYEQDEDFKYIMIMKVVDNNTNKVINEIPSKKILDMVAQFCEMAGLIINKKA